MFSDETVICGRPRISPRTAEFWACIASVDSNNIGLILTRISTSSGVVTRDVSQNGNWIRVMSVMESFERPAPASHLSDLHPSCLSKAASCLIRKSVLSLAARNSG
jgi:hypothetical protein